MSIYYQDNHVAVYHGDCLDVLAAMPDNSVDSIITDPPYGLGFMGKKWDALPPSREWAEACYRVLKPGGHIVAFGGTRTWHRLAVAIEDAGFEMRDSLAWLYGSGFPKSMDVSKAVESTIHTGKSNSRSLRQTEQDGDGESYSLTGKNNGIMGETRTYERKRFAPQHDAAQQWDGWGTALKPAFEPIVLARKPLAEKTVAKNVLEHGTGAINVDACRIGYTSETDKASAVPQGRATARPGNLAGKAQADTSENSSPTSASTAHRTAREEFTPNRSDAGRWPANVLLDEHAAAWVDEQSGNVNGVIGMKKVSGGHNFNIGEHTPQKFNKSSERMKDSGGASRFFYCAKAPKSERPNVDGIQHPTVKPLAIMRWLIRLVTPPGGTVLDPFAGSGTTIEAAMMEGFHPVGIESEQDYLPLITARIARAKTTTQKDKHHEHN